MKKHIKTTGLAILLLTAVWMPGTLSGQFPGMPPMGNVYGYVVLSNGDTLPGLIKWKLKYVENNLSEIEFTAKNGNSKILTASEIAGFGYSPGESVSDLNSLVVNGKDYYESIPSLKKGVPVFIYRFLNGRIKVFLNRSNMTARTDVPVKTEGISFTYIPGGVLSIGTEYRSSTRIIETASSFQSFFVSKDKGLLIKVDRNNYDSIFQTLLGDCPEIEKECSRNPELAKFKNFILMAEVYNHICK
jgi:hypothetical protein